MPKGTSVSVWLYTNTRSTQAHCATAMSVVCFRGMDRPPRRPSFAVTTHLDRASRMRSRRESAEKPAKTTLQQQRRRRRGEWVTAVTSSSERW